MHPCDRRIGRAVRHGLEYGRDYRASSEAEPSSVGARDEGSVDYGTRLMRTPGQEFVRATSVASGPQSGLSTRSSPKRVGVLVQGSGIQPWQHSIVSRLLVDTRFEVVALTVADARSGGASPSARPHRGTIAWSMVNRLEARLSHFLFGRRGDKTGYASDALIPLERLDSVGASGGSSSQPRQTAPGRTLQIHDIAHTGELCLDVIVDFAGVSLTKADLGAVPGGVLSLRFGGVDVADSDLIGFREVIDGAQFIGVTLQLTSADNDDAIALNAATYAVFPYSWNENRRRVSWKARLLMLDALDDLAATGSFRQSRNGPCRTPANGPPTPMATPSLATVTRACAKLGWRVVRRAVSRLLWREQWQLLPCRGGPLGRDLSTCKPIVPPTDRYWADPFLVENEDDEWIFFEDFEYREARGRISCIRLTADGYDSYRTVLDQPYHLSYPFLFEYEGGLFMIPETHQNRTVELWRCDEFPDRWERVRVILDDISAVDTTLLEHDDRWWLFTNNDRSGLNDHGTELFVFFTDDPIDGEWLPHELNPVLVDARRARMGGGFIRTNNGAIVRCAQNGGPTYGSGLLLYEIATLTTRAYEERLVEELTPDWRSDAVGIHHCHTQPNLTIFDLCVRVPRIG